jgi:hypothetical protein
MVIKQKKIKLAYDKALALFIVVLVFFCGTSAFAGLMLDDTEHAMPGWYGTKTIRFFEEKYLKTVDGSIDYAVYAPGQFNLAFPNQDPSNGPQYVYRFQLFNNVGTSEDYLKKLTIGLININDASTWFCKWIEPNTGPYDSGGVIPDQSQVGFVGTPPTSVNWGYLSSGPIQPGNSSKMLIFTSSYAPTFAPATVKSRDTTKHYVDGENQFNWWEGQLPSPVVPEPASFAYLSIFCLVLLVSRGVLRRK